MVVLFRNAISSLRNEVGRLSAAYLCYPLPVGGGEARCALAGCWEGAVSGARP
jgi:hypothetical protein